MHNKQFVFGFVAFALYFLTGAACIVVGSGLSHFSDKFSIDLETVVLLGSLYSLGRVSTVHLTGRLVEKIGALKVTVVGIGLMCIYLSGIAYTRFFYQAMIFAFIGGAGMGAQDTVCPLFLSIAFPKSYAGSLSAGQALFGMGGFMTPFLIGVMLVNKLPFYFAYYVLLIFSVTVLIFIFFGKETITVTLKNNEYCNRAQVPSIKPLFTKNKKIAFAAILLATATYSTAVNTIGLYTTTFAESQGFSGVSAVFLLTVYNIGTVIGALIFIVILKRISALKILFFNSILSAGILFLMVVAKTRLLYYPCLFSVGFLLGVLFSLVVEVATRIGYEHISITSSYVAVAGGFADVLTPMITGFIVSMTGVVSTYTYAVTAILITALSVMIVQIFTYEK